MSEKNKKIDHVDTLSGHLDDCEKTLSSQAQVMEKLAGKTATNIEFFSKSENVQKPKVYETILDGMKGALDQIGMFKSELNMQNTYTAAPGMGGNKGTEVEAAAAEIEVLKQ